MQQLNDGPRAVVGEGGVGQSVRLEEVALEGGGQRHRQLASSRKKRQESEDIGGGLKYDRRTLL